MMEIEERRLTQEVEQLERFKSDPKWRRGRIRDAVAAREIAIEHQNTLLRGVAERGVSLADALNSIETTRRTFDAMPSFDVAVSLKTSYHQDPTHRWTINDVHDIDALGSTLPYCDIVVTDKAAASHVVRTGLDERLGAVVLARLADLTPYL